MKILMIHPHDLFSSMEPWTIRIVKLAEELTARGHEITIAYFPFSKGDQGLIAGVRLVPLERHISAGALIGNIKILYALARQADVVHFQKSQFYSAVPSLVAAYSAGKPLHYDWDDLEEKIFFASINGLKPSTILVGLSFQMLERCLPYLADSVTVSSEGLRQLAMRRGVDPARVFLVPVGADLQTFRPGLDSSDIKKKYKIDGHTLVFYHGQLHSCQYVRLFLKAIKLICEKGSDHYLRFMVLGSGSELAHLKAYAEELGVEDKVFFLGFVPHVEIPKYIAAADICVAPFEDNEVVRCKSPLKIVEYLAAGKAIVASEVGEVGNMVGGVGLLVRPGSPEEMARGILELAGDTSRRKSMAVAARQKAESVYNWRCSVVNLEKAYAATQPCQANIEKIC